MRYQVMPKNLDYHEVEMSKDEMDEFIGLATKLFGPVIFEITPVPDLEKP